MFENIKRLVKRRLHLPSRAAIRAGVSRCKHYSLHRKLRRLVKERDKIFLELGGGEKKGQGAWVTIDVTRHCDIFWDLANGLPFPDQSIAMIYSSHVLEHFSFENGQRLLDECRRVLISGGKFSICVPNARLYLEAYVRSEHLAEGIFFTYERAYNRTTTIDYVNYIAYMDGHHKYMFDEENLLHILAKRGFRNVRLRQFDPSLDLKVRDYESIYAEAEK